MGFWTLIFGYYGGGEVPPVVVYTHIGVLIGASKRIGTLDGASASNGILRGSSERIGTLEGNCRR